MEKGGKKARVSLEGSESSEHDVVGYLAGTHVSKFSLSLRRQSYPLCHSAEHSCCD